MARPGAVRRHQYVPVAVTGAVSGALDGAASGERRAANSERGTGS
ncbi:hypothetical protein ACFQ0M_30285 [Kitasatospora aburaviensis]